MHNQQVKEQPVLSGNEKRRKATLFDATPASAPRPTASVSKKHENEFELTGGLAMGLGVGSELKSQDAPTGQKPVRLRVTELVGLSGCKAIAIEGDHKSVGIGDVFVLDRWVSQKEFNLKVWIPPALGETELNQLVQAVQALREKGQAQFIDDPTDPAPSRFLQYSEGGWQSWTLDGKTEKPDLASFNQLAAGAALKETVFISLPPSTQLRSAIKLGPKTDWPAIEIVKSIRDAQYTLVGRVKDGKAEYAWVRPGGTRADAEKGGDPLPVRSDWVTNAEELVEKAVPLARVNGWLQLHPSTDEPFPFKLALRNTKTGEIIRGGRVYQGQRYDLVLVPEDAAKKASPAQPIKRQRVYVFDIDSFGKSTLFFPLGGNVENRFPLDPTQQDAREYDKPVTEPIQLGAPGLIADIEEPFGLDTVIMLASEQSMPDPYVLEFTGARSKGATRAGGNETELSTLVYGIGSATRGLKPKESLSWSLDRLMVRTTAKQSQ